jgi:hypothetical protein
MLKQLTKAAGGAWAALYESSQSNSTIKETTCQNEFVIRAGNPNLYRVARPVRMVISRARTARTAMNIASFAGIRSDSGERWGRVPHSSEAWVGRWGFRSTPSVAITVSRRERMRMRL